jgi:hypothetical protein
MADNQYLESLNSDFVRARLGLAQALLEDSDRLPGDSGYYADLWAERHPRHEREALVNYLLLTCIDKLGQKRRFLSFDDWLNSKKAKHENERAHVLDGLQAFTSHEDAARALSSRYFQLYGVKNRFFWVSRAFRKAAGADCSLRFQSVSPPPMSLKECQLNLWTSPTHRLKPENLNFYIQSVIALPMS